MSMNKGGRPTRYRPEYANIAYRYCLLGATDKLLAELFDVSTVTINAWKKGNSEFLNALMAGKGAADANVAKSLYHRAIGYSHTAEQISINPVTGAITRAEYVKHYPPDVGAATMWLKNHQGKKWREKQTVEMTGVDEGSVQVERSISSELKALQERLMARLNENEGGPS